MPKITVLVASPSPVNRARLAKQFGTLAEVEVVAVAGDLSETFTWTELNEPDVVVVADEFRQIDDFDAMKSLFYALSTRWIFAYSGTARRPNPEIIGPDGRSIVEPAIDLTMSPAEILAQVKQVMTITRSKGARTKLAVSRAPQAKSDTLVLIGSSTGGVDALLTVLSDFPEDCPPTAIVQHTGQGFSDGLVKLLDRRCKPKVVAAQDGLILTQGMVCVAGGTVGHMIMNSEMPFQCQIWRGQPVSGHVPSVDALFRSAVPFAQKVIAVILTGMGQDGAAGLLELSRAGAMTIGQDAASSVVYGMPKAAFEMGAVQKQLPVGRIGAEILSLSAQSARRSQALGHRKAAR